MKKLLLVFCITLSFIIPDLRAYAQTTIDWSCFTTNSTLASANDIVTLPFTNANCPAANGFSLQGVGTGQLIITFAIFNGVSYVRTTRNAGAATVLTYSRFFKTSGGLFTLSGISVGPTNVTAAAGGSQSITLHAYRNGVEVGTASTGTLSANLPAAIPSAQLSAFANIDEVRFTSSSATVIGIGFDDIVVTSAGNAPTVTTGSSSAITANSATLAGNVSSDGGATVNDKGIVYATTANPSITDNKLANGNGTGAISANASSLLSNTTYHYRAYATNTIGTSYGADQTFKTLVANQAPVAATDNYTYTIGTPLVVAAPGVLGNDTDPDSNPLTAIKVTNPAHGTLVLNANGSFTYTPSGNTADSFTYKANDGTVDGNTVTVNLTPANVAPVAVADNYTYTIGTPLVIGAPGVLNNDNDANGNTLAAILVNGPALGSLVLNANGSFTYTPAGNTADSFTYKANDGTVDGNTVTVTLSPANQAPVLVASGGTTTYSGSPVVIDNGITVSDADNTTLFQGTVSITGNLNLAQDVLVFTPSANTDNITGSYNVLGGIFNLSSAGGSATIAQWQAALRAISYQNSSSTPSTLTRTISFRVSDASLLSAPVTKTVTISPAAISTTGTLSALTTTYGTASSSGTFNVSGLSLGSGILVAAPTGFEVSADNSTFANTVTVGAAGTISSTPVYIRLAAGTAAGNYSGNVVLSATGATSVNVATVLSTVNKVALTVTASAGQNKIYGNVDPTLAYTITTGALVGTDAFTGSLTRAPGENFGTYAIQQGSLALSSNYTLTYVGANFTINKAAITLTADTKNKVYGTADPFLSFKITSGTLKFADTFSGSLTRIPGEDVGTYTIQQGSLALSNNYTLTYIAGNMVVTPAPLTITANNKGKAFGQAITGGPGSTEFTSSGLVGLETIGSVTLTYGTGAATGAPVGTYTGSVVASAATDGTFNAGNYTITYVAGNIIVGQAILTITANNASKTYGAVNPAFSVSYSGFIGTDDASSLTTLPTISTTAVTGSPVNTYPINVSGAVSSNYTIVYNPGTLTVNPAVLTITADNNTKVYGAVLPALTVGYSGFVGTDNASSLTTAPTISTTATTASPVNTYPITASGAISSNYTFVYQPGTLTVTPAALTITANNNTKVYGAAMPLLTVGYGGFVGTDDASSLTTQPTLSTTAVTTSPVNTYPITASGAVSANYTITYQPGTLTVTPAALTITANSDTKVYGAPVPTLTVSYSGFVGTDNASSLTTQPIIIAPVTANSPVNTYPITAGGAASANYTFTYQPGTLTVTPAALTITANSDTKVYGAPVPTLTVSYSGFVGTDNASSLITQPTLSTTAVANSPVNTYPITASGAVSANYTLVYQPGTLTVTPAVLTITANNSTKVYGAVNPALVASYNGFIGTDDASSLTTQPTISTTAVTNSPVNTYPITASGAVSSNYTFVYQPGTLTVTAAPLTITANNKGKAFGQAISGGAGSTEFTSTGLVNSETIGSVTITYGTGAAAGAPANTYTGSVVPSAATGGSFDAGNYTITYVAGNIVVGQALLTITANNASKTYGAANPTLSVSYSGFIGTDDASSLTTQPSISTTAVTGSPVNTYPITASGAVSSNYTIVYQPGTLTVNPAALTITADNNTKVYGAPVPTLAVSYSGFVGTDDASSLTTAPTITTIAVANSPVNTYPITASGAVSANYTIAYTPGTLTVTPAALTITADNNTKVYGAALPSLTASYSGFVSGDNSSSLTTQPAITTTAVANSPVNTYPITASGAVSANYTITYNSGTLTVTPAALTITADNNTKVYGAAVPTLTVSYSGFVGGDNSSSLTTQPVITTTAVTNSPVNTYPITASGAVSANYTIAYTPGTLTVTPAVLTITANNNTKVYGAPVPALAVSYSGFVGSDNSLSLTTQPAITTTAVANSPVNTYPITVSGAVSPNYTFVYQPGILTVTKAVLNITADSFIKIYGVPNPVLSVSYSGFAGSDDASSLTIQPTTSTTANTTSPVNTYPITVSGAVSANYSFVYKPGVLTITKAVLTITAKNANKVFGTANPVLGVSYSGFAGTDNASSLTTQPVTSTTAVDNSPVNTYPITVSGAASLNYSFVYKPGVLTISKAVLTITANNATKVYGSANPILSVSYSGFTGTDDASSLTTAPAISTTAVIGSPVNTYPITASGAASANYSFVYKAGVLTVTKAVLTITANNATKIYGTVNPLLGVSYSGFVGTDKESCLITLPTTTTTAITTSPAGTYPITAKGAVASNYSFVYQPGILTVTKAVLTITAKNATKVYGTVNPALAVTYTGFAGTDNAASLTTAPTISTTAVTTSPVNTYPIAATGAVSANYSFVYKPGVLTVTKAVLTITADNLTKPYGAANPVLTASYSGFAGTDDASSLTKAPALSTTATTNSPVNTYPITVGGAASPNYSFIYKPGVLTVTQPVLTITANSVTKTYGSANPELSVSYSGFVNGDNSSSLTKAPAIVTTASTSSNAGTYPITVSGAAIANYKIVYVPGTVSINKATLTVTVDNKSRAYGTPNPALTDVYSGFVNGDNQASLTTQPVLKTAATTTSAPGSYPITASGGVSVNYNFNYVAGVLTVTPLSISTLNDLSLSAGKLSPAFSTGTAAYTTQVENEVEDIRLTLTFDATATAKVNGTSTRNGSPSAGIPLNVGYNTITAVVTAQDGVTTNTYTVTVYRGESQDAIVGTNILTPNGDGKNDFWIVNDIQLFPNNTVVVYDRGGRTVYTKHGYANDWGGTFGGSPLTEGTYYYTVDLGQGQRKFRGYITILRTR
jgi:gliding motility-associated-like protein